VVVLLLLVGVVVAAFVGFNIGGSSTGVAFGPAVGSRVVTKTAAAALMTGFAFLGGATVGRGVIDTLSQGIIPASTYTLPAAVVVLFFVGLALLISNLFGVPASTSMTAVGAIAGLGAATATIRWGVLGGIVTWWLVAPIVAFWSCAMIGRYVYPYLEVYFTVDQSEGPLLDLDRSGAVPRPVLGEDTTLRELFGNVIVVAIACYMAFSAGASNFANAVGPLVGVGAARGGLSMNQGILIAAVAVGLGAFTIARRTLETVGNDLTDLPILAAVIVEVVSATIIALLSAADIPASLAVSATMCIVGLGWGRATRTTTLADAASAAVAGEGDQPRSQPGRITAGERGVPTVGEPTPETEPDPEVPAIGEEATDDVTAGELFDPGATGRVIVLWMMTPSVAAAGSYLVFEFLLPVGT
jgi:PiT family inorganic phosphate transporter